MRVTFSDGTSQQYHDTPIAKGGQGEVFRSEDGLHVVKLYYDEQSTPRRREQLHRIIDRHDDVNGDAYWADLFAWPEKVAITPRLGVRSRFVDGRYSLDHYFFASGHPLPGAMQGWWLGRVAAAIKIARAIGRVATQGLCLGDISDRNILVDPYDGSVTLVDCESLVVPREIDAVVLGTLDYMAPELVMERVRKPSVETDRHALAVILYRWLLGTHPLLGRKHHSPDPYIDDTLALGQEALFIENSRDVSNRPLNRTVSCQTLTRRLDCLFRLAFEEGLYFPHARPSAGAWEEALVELFDRTIPCNGPVCPQGHFAAPEQGRFICPWCGYHMDYPLTVPYLKLVPGQDRKSSVMPDQARAFDQFIVAWPGRAIHLWHIDQAISPSPGSLGQPPDSQGKAIIEFDAPTGDWHLRNVALTAVQVRERGLSSVQTLRQGVSIALQHGMTILFTDSETAHSALVEMRRA